jgi:hypothetical protein
VVLAELDADEVAALLAFCVAEDEPLAGAMFP